MLSKLEAKIVLIALLFLIPVTAGLSAYVLLQASDNSRLSTSSDGYVTPKWIGSLVERVQESLVTVNCLETIGSGFAFDLDATDMSNDFDFISEEARNSESLVITNAHVIEGCMDECVLRITINDESTSMAKVLKIDLPNDLALLESEVPIKPLSGVYWKPRPGYWTMASGSPHNFAGSVTFGNIINLDSNLLFHTASLSPGNSGGPLVDNEGFVYGVNTGSKPVGQNFNISIGINAFCDQLFICPKSKFWDTK
jgi:S1-C subfamily serine protease